MAVPTGKCAGKTGKEEEVKVRHGEGVAIRTGPEPCVGTREGVDEASVGEHIGQPLSRENLIVSGADVFESTEGNTDGGDSASPCPTRRGPRPWHVWTLFAREPGDLGFGQRRHTAGPHREDEESKPMMHEPERSDSAIVARKPANKAGRPAAEPVERFPPVWAALPCSDGMNDASITEYGVVRGSVHKRGYGHKQATAAPIVAGVSEAGDCSGKPGAGCVGVAGSAALRRERQSGLCLAAALPRRCGGAGRASLAAGDGDAGSSEGDGTGRRERGDRDRVGRRLSPAGWRGCPGHDAAAGAGRSGGDRRKVGGQAATAIGGCGSLAGRNFCPK